MAVFIGNSHERRAVTAAFEINYAVKNIINVKIKAAYPKIAYEVKQAVGIDTSELFVAKTGIRGSNDLVWVGRAANYAAKLCALRQGNLSTLITQAVFDKLPDSYKFFGNPKQYFWTIIQWKDKGIRIYGAAATVEIK
jgi:class 3 adenylate cyclase